LIECWRVVRHVSQLHFNQLFSNNKVIIKIIQYSPISMDLSPIPLPCSHSLEYSLSHPCLYFRWPTQGTATTTTTWTTTERTTKMSTCRHPLRLHLSKCWLCKHKCFRLCSRLWSTCRLLNLKCRHRRRGISFEIFSAPSRLPFLMLWSR
jgi:hypothetical protein